MITIKRTKKMNWNSRPDVETLFFNNIEEMNKNFDKSYVREILTEGYISFRLCTNEGFGTLDYEVITA